MVSGRGATVPHAIAPNMTLGGMSQAAHAAAGGLFDAAEVMRRSEEEEGRAWATSSVSEARLKWTQELANRQANAEPNAPGFTPNLLNDYDSYMQEAVGQAPTKSAKKFLGERLLEYRTMLGEHAIGFETKARLDWRNDQFTGAIENGKKTLTTDPSQFKDILAEQLAVVDGSAMPPIQKSAIRDKAISGLAEAAVWAQIKKAPAAFLTDIGFMGTGKRSGDIQGLTGNAAFDMLPFDKKTHMLDLAVREKAANDADVDKRAKEERQKLSDNAMKDIWGKLADKTLRRSDIEGARLILPQAEYHSALKALEAMHDGRGQKSDPATFNRVQRLLTDEKYDEAVDFAFMSHRNGQLSNDNLSTAVERARSHMRQETPKSQYERSKEHLVRSLDPGPGVPDPVGHRRAADAVLDFDSWFQGGKRTDDEVKAYGKETVDRYQFLNLSDTVLGLPQPRSGRISKNVGNPGQIMQEIANAAEAAMQKRDQGKLTAAEYDSEMEIMNRWRKAITGMKK